MRQYLVVLAALGTMSAPSFAQAPAAATAAPQAQTQQAQTVKKRVCTREVETGSRVSGGKVCKIVEVPATGSATSDKGRQQQPQPAAGAHH